MRLALSYILVYVWIHNYIERFKLAPTFQNNILDFFDFHFCKSQAKYKCLTPPHFLLITPSQQANDEKGSNTGRASPTTCVGLDMVYATSKEVLMEGTKLMVGSFYCMESLNIWQASSKWIKQLCNVFGTSMCLNPILIVIVMCFHGFPTNS